MASQRRGISIFRAANARGHLPADAPEGSEPDYLFQLAEEQIPPMLATSEVFASGAVSTELVRNAGGFGLLHLWWKPNFPLPRHSHDSDCLYYVVSGTLVMGNRTLRSGDSFFVPSNAPYQYTSGPDGAEVLEIRHGVAHTDMTWLGDTDQYVKTVHEAMEENRETWTNAVMSPTFAANAAG